MSLARLVVIDGPDSGREFELPLRGGGIGRGDGNLVQLTDPAVSRQHGTIELRDGALCWVDDALDRAHPRTLINGQPAHAHPLAPDDEIVLGATRLRYVTRERAAPPRVTSNVTMEVGSRQLLALTGYDDRSRRHLALAILGATRAFVVLPGGRKGVPVAAVAAGEDTQLQVLAELADRVIAGKQIITADTAQRALIVVPIHGGADEVVAVLWIDRPRASGAWDSSDALAASCLAHLVGAAWVGSDTRDQLVRRADALEDQLLGPLANGDFIGRSAPAQRVRDFVQRVGPSDTTVLLGGESGSGKEMVSRAIHRASRRAKGPFVAVNCAALTESLIESELFGHEKGAFTGATDRKAGRFEMADRGTLFLDEVGELPLGLQTKFLRVLEEKRFERVGGQKAIEVDVRLVAATNRDLFEMVKRGTFREDLYYRLAIIHIDVPPLRDRQDDVPLLAEYFFTRFRHQATRRLTGFAPETLAAMQRYPWPGNVRELRNCVERAIVLGDQPVIVPEDLPPQILRTLPRSSPTPPLGSNALTAPPSAPQVVITRTAPVIEVPTPKPPARSLRDLEKEGILAALAATSGNKAQAAAILEIDRSTLYKKLKDYDIS
ncbi:MAG: sigma 54-interacting transcriptional regulator [Proteobacteria bacterium]|nr:sigma 54-interacting transcriptional regulator [Pseudomonadota bacterium]